MSTQRQLWGSYLWGLINPIMVISLLFDSVRGAGTTGSGAAKNEIYSGSNSFYY
jgi:hypothetical protein